MPWKTRLLREPADGVRRLRPLPIGVSLLIVACAATAAAVMAKGYDDLYSAQTVVTGTVEPERTRGFRAGLTDVVIKLTGDVRLAGDARLRPLLVKPHRFVERFEYEDRMKGIPVHDEQGTRERPHYLRMRFKPAAMDAALAQLGLSKWPAPRPRLAVWLGVVEARDSFVLRDAGPEGYGQRLVVAETAARRGIPVWLPAADTAVTVDDIEAGDAANLQRAAPDADALLAGVLALVPGGYWDITWRFRSRNPTGDRTKRWTMRRVTFDTAIKGGLETAALILSGNATP